MSHTISLNGWIRRKVSLRGLKSLCRKNMNFNRCGIVNSGRNQTRKYCSESEHNPTLTDSEIHRGQSKMMDKFNLNDYDCIGFDLDNTLLWYNVTEMVRMEYNVLANYLAEHRGYDSEYLCKPLEKNDIDFMQKGLILDFDRGNILKVSSDGVIGQASHGTKSMTIEEIQQTYPDFHWDVVDTFINDPVGTWNAPGSLKMRCLLDYFDMPASLAFARAVDAADNKSGMPIEQYEIWPDILAGLIFMFDRKHFKQNIGQYFPNLKTRPEKYIRKCSPMIVSWLREMKKNKLTFLITGSNADFMDFTAKYGLDEDWRSLFDITICYARKPGFFTENRPFMSLSGYDESTPVIGKDLIRQGIYSQGNWPELNQFFKKITNKDSPRCLYFGDNIIQDIYTPAAHIGWDTVVVSEEMDAERTDNELSPHPDTKTIISRYWGSYFFTSNTSGHVDSLWSQMIGKYSKICIPSMKTIANNPLNMTYETFGSEKHYKEHYPAKPVHTDQISA